MYICRYDCTATINHCTLQLRANQLVCHLVQGQNTLTFRGRSRRNKEDVNEVLYQEDIEVSTDILTAPIVDLQHTSVVGCNWHASGCGRMHVGGYYKYMHTSSYVTVNHTLREL